MFSKEKIFALGLFSLGVSGQVIAKQLSSHLALADLFKSLSELLIVSAGVLVAFELGKINNSLSHLHENKVSRLRDNTTLTVGLVMIVLAEAFRIADMLWVYSKQDFDPVRAWWFTDLLSGFLVCAKTTGCMLCAIVVFLKLNKI